MVKKWSPYVAIVAIFGLMFWMSGCSTADERPQVQGVAQQVTEEPAQAETPVEEPAPEPEPETVILESTPTTEEVAPATEDVPEDTSNELEAPVEQIK